jgi:hypothetical protein
VNETPVPENPTDYEVWVDDNFDFMDDSGRVLLGRYRTYEEAEAAAKAIVDRFLEENLRNTKSAEDLYDSYTSFGDDPFIKGPDAVVWETNPETGGLSPRPRFSAWNYARQRCEEIFTNRNRPSPPMSP